MTKAEEKELNSLCNFYIKDKKFIEAFKVGITKFIEKYQKGVVKKQSFEDIVNAIIDKKLNEP
jgi:hypothetical protein|tara:strand:- start:1617 stop:1805 length:189 start_codon:yes stop_codon:yes gene_type:complete